MKRAALYWVQATPQLMDAVEGNEYSSNQQENSIFPHSFDSCDQIEAAKFVVYQLQVDFLRIRE